MNCVVCGVEIAAQSAIDGERCWRCPAPAKDNVTDSPPAGLPEDPPDSDPKDVEIDLDEEADLE